ELLDLESLRARFAARLRIAMNGEADARRLQQVLAPYRASGGGACQVVVAYRNSAAACEVALGDAWRVRPDSRLLAELGAWLAPAHVQLIYGAAAVAASMSSWRSCVPRTDALSPAGSAKLSLTSAKSRRAQRR